MCNPGTGITVTNTTRNAKFYTEALNRLPVEDATVVYTDKGCLNNYALDDAYEVVVDVPYDYKVAHGCSITGTVSGIYGPSSSGNPTMQANRIILTARGSTQIAQLSSYKVGDSVTISVNTYDKWGHYTDLLHRISEGVGGHIPLVIDGEYCDELCAGLTNLYATSIIGYTSTGSIKLLTLDSVSSSSSSKYFRIADMPALCRELDIVNAFLLDGGGSATMVTLDSGSYKLQGTPSDGSERSVINAIILSHGPEKAAQGSFIPVPSYNDNLSELRFTSSDSMKYFLQRSSLKAEKLVSLGYSDTEKALEITTVTDNDPYFYINYSKSTVKLSADNYKYAVMTYKNPTTNSDKAARASLFPCAGSQTLASPTCSVTFDLERSNSYCSKVIDLSSLSAWTGTINAMRWDFFDEASVGDKLYVKSLILCKTEAEAAAVAESEKNRAEISFGSEKMLRHTPKIDGRLDDAYLASCGVVLDTTVIKNAVTGKPVSDTVRSKYAGDLWAYAYYLYDSNYIYAYVTVHDTTLTPASGVTASNAARNNNVYLSVWNGATWPGSSAEILLNATNGYAFASGSAGGFGSNFAAAYGTETPSTEYAYSLNSDGSGYVIEARIYAPGYNTGDSVSIALGANDLVTSSLNFWRFGNVYSYDKDASFDATVTLGDYYESHTHTWESGYTVDTPATCTSVGSKSIHCSGCGEIKPGSAVSIPMLSHSYVLSSSVAPTCVNSGTETYICSVCGKNDVRSIPALGHSYNADGICERCGYSEKPIVKSFTESGALKPGDTVIFTLSLNGCASLKSLRVIPKFDSSVFEIVSMRWLITGTSISDVSDAYAVAAYATETSGVGGDIFECELRVKDNAAAGEHSVGFDVMIKSKATGTETALNIVQPEDWTVTVEPAHVHSYVYSCDPAQKNSAYKAGHIGTCSVCNAVSEVLPHNTNELGICQDCGANVSLLLSGYNVSLANSLTVNILANKANLSAYDSFFLRIVEHSDVDITKDITEYTTSGANAQFKYGLPPYRIINDFDVYLVGVKDGQEYVATKPQTLNVSNIVYSNFANASTPDSMKTILVELLGYATEAQKLLNFKTDTLVDARLTEEQKATYGLKDDSAYTDVNKVTANSETTGQADCKRANIVCGENVKIRYTFTLDSAVALDTITVVAKDAEGKIVAQISGADNFKQDGNTAGRYYCDIGFAAHQLSDEIDIDVYVGNTLITARSLHTSVESAVARNTSSAFTALLDAMMRYGRAAALASK